MTTKVCTKCNKEKDVEEFYSHKTNSSQCKQCQRDYRKEWRKNHPGYDKIKSKKWYYSNQERNKKYYENKPWYKIIIQLAKKRAKKSGIPFNLDEEYLQSIYPKDGLCPLLRIPLTKNREFSGPNSITLDRIIPQLGYIKGNVQILSHKANTAKSNLTLDEMKLLVSNWELSNYST